MRQTTRSLPGNTAGNPASSYQYYGATETRDNPCTTEVEALHQAGFMKMRTEADGDGSGVNTGITTETIYDAAGHQVAARKNQDGWTCTSYDVRGRAVQTVVPTVNGRAGRTTATNYSYQGSPFKTQSVDSVSGNTVVETDLLGRQIASTDTFGNAYTVTYDNFGKVLIKTSPLGTEEYTYDNLNRVTEQKLDGVVYASLAYDQFSRVATVTYPQAKNTANAAMTLEQVKRDGLQRDSGAVYRFSDGSAFDETVTRSVTGAVTAYSDTFDSQTAGAAYQYDNAGRLTSATVDQNQYAYSYAAPSSTVCNQSSANLNANKNSNRTATTVNGATTTNCYNQADQLVSSTDTQIGTPTYDDHGNTVSLAGAGTPITFTYDASDQNTAITQGGNKVEYVKSASGSVLRKKEYENNTLVRSYRYLAGGNVVQACSLTDDNSCVTTDKCLTVAGNIAVTLLPTNPDQTKQIVHSIKNFHGDVAMTVGINGVPTSNVFLYEPFGMASASATFGTNSNPQNATNSAMGWAADPSRKQEQLFSVSIMQMGARVYMPSLGRFLQVDPIEGGTANAYVYAEDPVNKNDYSGQSFIDDGIKWVKAKATEFFTNVATTLNTVISVAAFSKNTSQSGRGYMRPSTAELDAYYRERANLPMSEQNKKDLRSWKQKVTTNEKYEAKRNTQKRNRDDNDKNNPTAPPNIPSNPYLSDSSSKGLSGDSIIIGGVAVGGLTLGAAAVWWERSCSVHYADPLYEFVRLRFKYSFNKQRGNNET